MPSNGPERGRRGRLEGISCRLSDPAASPFVFFAVKRTVYSPRFSMEPERMPFTASNDTPSGRSYAAYVIGRRPDTGRR